MDSDTITKDGNCFQTKYWLKLMRFASSNLSYCPVTKQLNFFYNYYAKKFTLNIKFIHVYGKN